MKGELIELLPELQIVGLDVDSYELVQPMLKDDTFEMLKRGEIFGVAAIEDGILCGVLCISVDENNRNMEVVDIVTVEEKRRQGVASTLLAETIDRLQDSMDYELQRVHASFTEDGNGVQNFYEYMGFYSTLDEASSILIYTLDTVRNSYLMNKKIVIKPEYTIKRYEELVQIDFRKMKQQVEALGGFYDVNFETVFDPHFSTSLWKGDQLAGIAEIVLEKDKSITISQFITDSTDMSMLGVLQRVLIELEETFDASTKINVYTIADSTLNLTEKLLGQPVETYNLCDATLILNN